MAIESAVKTLENIKQAPVQMIGLNTTLKGIYEEIQMFAPHNLECLITGENGTGKEMIAQLIHALSQRNNAPFIKVNCASIPAELFESELFGYERGAFTGANNTKPGLIEMAAGGTLFLDEIGELPIQLQPKLLWVLQDKKMYKVGGTKEITVDFRLISATNINIEKAIDAGKFREDLYHRISSFVIELPPLRARQEDFKALVNFLLAKNAKNLNLPPIDITDEALSYLKKQVWPGNIRQLEKTLRRALVLCKDQEYISLNILEQTTSNQQYDYRTALYFICNNITHNKLSFEEIETDILKELIALHDNNIQLTSRQTGYSQDKLYRILRKAKDKHRAGSVGGEKIIRFIG